MQSKRQVYASYTSHHTDESAKPDECISVLEAAYPTPGSAASSEHRSKVNNSESSPEKERALHEI